MKSSPRATEGPLLLLALAGAGVTSALWVGCSGDDANTAATSAGGGSASSTSASTSSASSSSTGSATSTASSGVGGAGGSGTGGGEGGAGGTWPTCDAPDANATTQTIHEIWQKNPTMPELDWVPGVYVTAVSSGGCTPMVACQIFVQQAETFADLGAGAQQAMKMFISAKAAEHFVGIQVGDQVDVEAWAWRYNLNGENELLLQVNAKNRGCAKVVGAGDPQPVDATLADLTLDAYENTLGPLLVKLSTVSGKPHQPAETFGLWNTGTFADAGPDTIVSLSPFFLSGGVFDNLTAEKIHDFGSLTGVFGLFVPDPTAKFKELYPRTDADIVIDKVQP